MPPLPTTFDEATTSSISALQRRLADLAEFQIPRLRTCKESLTVQQRYAAELREDTEGIARLIEALEESVDDQRGERARHDLQGVVDGFKADLARLRKDARAALLVSKRAIDAQAVSSREELLRSSVMHGRSGTGQTSEGKTTEDALMKAHNDVTDALRRTMGLMQGELERSVLSVQMLESSTATLKSTSAAHDTLDFLLGTSKQLVTALEKADWLDRLLIVAGLAFFLLVVLFILKQRVVDRSIRLAFWWTRFLPARGEAAALVRAEKGRAVVQTLTSAVTASSLAGAVSATVASVASTTLAQVSQATAAMPPEVASSVTEVVMEASVAQDLPEPSTSLPPDDPVAGVPHDEL
ncbi:Sec20-domain-containing protein [Auriscalpium vulgare]|uniref:Sec20-domain-containing protein n=1 Tax=Auriscalpium vulgare TaxID=40419 RepID=A0ACB8RYE6_9AGAM|nr:Sec20-domain-containing protein [Auriscalpium vulgare]